jgi:hypothetical protein
VPIQKDDHTSWYALKIPQLFLLSNIKMALKEDISYNPTHTVPPIYVGNGISSFQGTVPLKSDHLK